MALRGGARSVLLHGQVGVLAPGALADIVLLRLNEPAFVPLHDPANHLVYCESGRDVDVVLVGGNVVVEHGRVTTIDAGVVYAEIAELMPGFMQMLERAYAVSRRLEPVLRQVYERCQRQTSEMNRFATPPSEWAWPEEKP